MMAFVENQSTPFKLAKPQESFTEVCTKLEKNPNIHLTEFSKTTCRTGDSFDLFATESPGVFSDPNQTFVDFTKDLNAQLYELIGLDEHEIRYVEQKIKAIDSSRFE